MMKMTKFITAALIAILATGCASTYTLEQGAADSKNSDGTPKQAAFGGHIVRNTHYFTSPAKNLDIFAKECMEGSPEWKAADSKGREALMEVGREKWRKFADMGFVQYAIGRHAVFHNRYTRIFAPKGMFMIGEEITLKTVPQTTAQNGFTCPNPKWPNVGLAVDGIFKCHDTKTLITGEYIGGQGGTRCDVSPRKQPYPIFTDSRGRL